MRGDLLILLADGIVILCLARLFLQAAGLSENHALLAFSKRSTDWLVNPLHKILPVKKYDPACLLSGLLLFRLPTVQLFALLFQLPPRLVRSVKPDAGPVGFSPPDGAAGLYKSQHHSHTLPLISYKP